MSKLKIKIIADNPMLLKDIYGENNPASELKVKITEGIDLVHERHIVRQGFVDSGVIISFMLTIGAGVATNLLSTWLLDKIKDNKVQIEINGESVITISKDNIEKIIVKNIKESNADR